MNKRSTITISESIGEVSILETTPANCIAVLILAHGAGAGMEHSFMETLANDLAALNIASVRYNFPYMEQGRKRPDVPAIAEKTVAVVCEWAHQKFKKVPVFVGGKSYGGRMSSQRLAKECPEYIKGIVFYSFPLHGLGKESVDRADHLKNISIPMLFLQGTKDKLATIELIRKVCMKLPTAKLVELEGADHSFKVTKKFATPDLPGHTAEWMKSLL